ncbi:MAG: prepilin-type N-terminal cleavage/methylation domain-containing protein [Sedimentisphaerales bacterium]|nr:prepilin-type N-terminal cleavage/methylation domain-containing protein [Sedimentisphaerales bacterium]
MKNERRKAFTFVEVIAALAVVSIALVGLLHMHLLSVKTANAAQSRTEAVLLARAKMTEALCWQSQEAPAESGTTDVNGSRYAWRTEITNVSVPQLQNLRGDALRQLRVSVTWQEGAGQKSVEMATYVADTAIHE